MELYQILQTQGSAEVSDMADHFQVSTMTIRRDFAKFERQGLPRSGKNIWHVTPVRINLM